MNAADLRIGRVVLRGTAPAIESARATLPAALARAHWPDGEAIVVVRRVTVGGTATELPARAAAAAGHLTRGAADPWSPAADSANTVRFRDALDYRACLVRDLLAGTAARRWLWRHRAALLTRPAAEALAGLLAEDALALPALLDRPALRASLPALWRALDAPAARIVLHAIGAATGWHGAVTRALAPTTTEGRTEKRSASRMPGGGTPAAPSIRSIHTAAHSAHPLFGSSALRSLPPHDLPPTDPRVILQAVLALWTQTPATLAGTHAAEALRATAEGLVRAAAAAGPETQDPREPHTAAADASSTAGEAAPGPTKSGTREHSLPLGGMTRRALPPGFAADATARNTGDAPANAPSPMPSEVSSAAASSAAFPPAAEHDFRTRGGGFFFLLNVLNLPVLRDWRATLAEPHAGWRELVRLARWLDFTPDAPLAAFLIDACGLDAPATSAPGDPTAALATLPAGADPAPVRRAAQRHYGDDALAAACAERPARIRASASHVDVRLRLTDVDLDIRRTGLDLDPGWLPWLGRVVRFHYDSGDLAR